MRAKHSNRSEVRRKTDKIFVRVTPLEKQRLHFLAQVAGLTVPELLRRNALSNKPLTIIDKAPLRELLKTSADLGRLGGLLKLWLSEYPDHEQKGDVKRHEIRLILRQISDTNSLLKEHIKTFL